MPHFSAKLTGLGGTPMLPEGEFGYFSESRFVHFPIRIAQLRDAIGNIRWSPNSTSSPGV